MTGGVQLPEATQTAVLKSSKWVFDAAVYLNFSLMCGILYYKKYPTEENGIMNGSGNVVKIIISIFIVLLIVLGAVGVVISVKDNRQHRAEIAEKEARAETLRLELDPLKRERQELESELARLEASYAEGAGAPPAFAVIFRDTSAEVYESAFPALTNYGYTASVAVEDPATIGTAGMLDVSMLLRLSAAGWSFCAAWDGTDDGAAHFESVKKSMAEMGITLFPAVLYTGATLAV